MLLEKIILPDVQKVTGNINKKVTACGIISLLTDTHHTIDGIYSHYWYVLTINVFLFKLTEPN